MVVVLEQAGVTESLARFASSLRSTDERPAIPRSLHVKHILLVVLLSVVFTSASPCQISAPLQEQAVSLTQLDERPAGAGEWGFRPRQGSVVRVHPAALVVRPQKNVVRYEWQCSPRADFATSIVRSTTRYPVWLPSMLNAGEWHWRFRCGQKNGQTTAWSRTRTFSVATNAAQLGIGITPAAWDREQIAGHVPTEHPRLFVRPEAMDLLRARSKDSLAPDLLRLTRECEKTLAKPPATTEPPKYPKGTVRGSEAWRKIWWGNRRTTIAVLRPAADRGGVGRPVLGRA